MRRMRHGVPHDDLPADGRGHQHREDEVARCAPATNSMPAMVVAEDDGGAEVGLLEQQHHHDAGDHERRQEADGEAADLLGLAGEQVGEVDAQRELGQLGGLERQRARGGTSGWRR